MQESSSEESDVGSKAPFKGHNVPDVGTSASNTCGEREEQQHEMEHVKHEERENKHLDAIEKNVKKMKQANKKILRGEMIRDLMKKNRGMKLGEASRYIKEHNLI